MKVLTEDSIVDLILQFADMPSDVSQSLAFAREVEAMTLREVFKRIQPEEKEKLLARKNCSKNSKPNSPKPPPITASGTTGA